MNERIQKLMGKTLDSEFSHTWDTMTYEGLLQFSEKFAELIVQECAELAKKKAFIIMQKAEEYAADKEEMINATSAAWHVEILGQEIRKHFGVEE
jgi:tRNA U54 and U55 pseudouridine synthase Pus10